LNSKNPAKEVEVQDKKLINYKIGEKKYFVKENWGIKNRRNKESC
jgi:hypothetical protein